MGAIRLAIAIYEGGVSLVNKESIARPSSLAAKEKWLSCNGQQLRKLTQAGLATLEENHRKVNDLNVFPVPDGDTGTNMLLTMRSAYERIQNNQELHVGRMAQEISHGALMGARGNSGVILSQIWRGFASSIKDKGTFDAKDLAAGLREASDTAYKGVMRPVEGTILTVIREGAEEAEETVGKSRDLRFLLARVVERCQQALARTPEMLPVLKQAGVVDAGGQGLVYLLDGMLRYVYGDIPAQVSETPVVEVPAQVKAAPAEGLENPYDVQYILMGKDLDLAEVRNTIDAMGDSTVVVGDKKSIKVHVHVKDPGKPISYGISLGRITDVVVENMQLQMEDIIGQARQIQEEEVDQEFDLDHVKIGVVAVAAGDGLAQIFRSLGVSGIVNGGQSNNPSTEEIYQVVEQIPADNVIILPNNKNIILAAEAVRDISGKHVAVVPTRTAPQGISAMLALNREEEMQDAVAAMVDASDQVASGEIAVATRSVTLNDVDVEEGQIIGVVDGQLCVAESDIEVVLQRVLEEMDMGNRELVSLYYGLDVTEEEAREVADKIESLYPEVEIELLSGGQPIYKYILGAE
jgi:DAK2 domain fusion protein YloV